jgi:N,N'-diacetyllegionaminate synthase
MVEIICEAGLNHLGKLDIAKKMVEAACAADADAIKFQTFNPLEVFHEEDSNFKLMESLTLSAQDVIDLAKFCKSMEIEFLSTPGGLDSLRFLVEEVGVRRIKIGSDDLTNKKLIDTAAQANLPLIISTGMATIGEVKHAIEGLPDVTLLHCVSLYPCPPYLANLKCIDELRRFGCPVGYSDHTTGTWACVAATAMGATIIEKHFDLADHSDCVDAPVSINEHGLVALVQIVRTVEAMLGDGFKYPSPEEAINRELFRKGPDGRRPLSKNENSRIDPSTGRFSEASKEKSS